MKKELSANEIDLLLEIICEEQTNGVVKKAGYFLSKRYLDLEKLKMKLKNMKGDKT